MGMMTWCAAPLRNIICAIDPNVCKSSYIRNVTQSNFFDMKYANRVAGLQELPEEAICVALMKLEKG